MAIGVGLNRIRLSSRFAGVRSLSIASDSDSIEINWLAPGRGTPTSYQVQRSTDGENWGNQQTVTPPTVTYTYSGLSAGTYYVRVRAVYAEGNSRWSASGAIVVGFTGALLGFFLV